MFSYDDLVRDSELQPDELWLLLDSFWSHRTVPTTTSLVRYLTYGMLTCFLDNYVRCRHFQSAYDIQTLETYLRLPWVPIIIYEDELLERSFVAYGEGYIYDPVPQIFYGQSGPVTRWVYPVSDDIVSVDAFTDAIVDSSYWAATSSAVIDRRRSEIQFLYNPFTSVAAKTAAGNGRRYIVLWARNLVIDLKVPFDQVGWVVQYQANNSEHYRRSLKQLWKLVLNGPSLKTYLAGINAALGLPLAEAGGTVRAIQSDGGQRLVITDTEVYRGALSWPLSYLQGDQLQPDAPIFEVVKPFEYEALLTASAADVPGLLLNVPLSTGTTAQLGFKNEILAWDFQVGRPSEWRFPISGSPADVEQFWIDSDAYAVANGINLQVLFGLPAAVNPMKMVVEQLLKSKVVVFRVHLAMIPVSNPSGFHDRALELLSPGTLLVLQQDVGSFFDSYDLGSSTSETVGYGYHILAPTETISISGTDLTYFDYTPFVVTA